MKKILVTCLCLLAPSLWGYTKIPDTLKVGGYSVSLKLPDTWLAQVFDKQGCIAYSGLEPTTEGKVAIEIRVYRVAVPVEMASLEGRVIAGLLVHDDGLKFQRSVFRHWFLFPRDPVMLSCPAGTAFIYADDDASFHDQLPHFARSALILPKDYQNRKIGYFVVAHQAGGRDGKQAQKEYFDAIIQGIRENG